MLPCYYRNVCLNKWSWIGFQSEYNLILRGEDDGTPFFGFAINMNDTDIYDRFDPNARWSVHLYIGNEQETKYLKNLYKQLYGDKVYTLEELEQAKLEMEDFIKKMDGMKAFM